MKRADLAPLEASADVVVVGSGPAGASSARSLARTGARVIVLEEGAEYGKGDFVGDAFGAMTQLYRESGAMVVSGPAFMPYLQGKCVGGGSVFNGAICWRLPRDAWERWVAADRALEDGLSWASIEAAMDEVDRDLEVAPTDPAIAGRKNELMAKGAAALGLEARPIRRNVRGCEGLGRCLQGCPRGHKLSMEASYLVDARAAGALVWPGRRVDSIEVVRGRATGVVGTTATGERFSVKARRAVVLAASAVQSPCLLLRSGIGHGPVGDNFQAHPGVAVGGYFAEDVRMWEGATQGFEVIGLRHEGLKFEALGFGAELLAARLPGYGPEFARAVGEMSRWLQWGAALRAEARGRVRPTGAAGAKVEYALGPKDLARARRGIVVLAKMMFAAGAERIAPGVHGWPKLVDSPGGLALFEDDGPTDPRAYSMAITHMFGTCRMGSQRETSVVRPDFRHHETDCLYVVDSSVFPTNTGVNPQNSIIALAAIAARRIAAS